MMNMIIMTMSKRRLPMKYLFLLFITFLTSAAKQPDIPAELRSMLNEKQPTYLIANAGLPYSYDPLEELNLNNNRIIRMIHPTIIESDSLGRFHSLVLKNFNYNHDAKTLILEVKDDVKYTDNTLLKVEDVALAIKRNAFLRPKLPGVAKIEGLSDWLKNDYPLLSQLKGVQTKGQKVFVKFTEDIESPLDKFAACFGVIPSSSVNMKTGKLIKEGLYMPPSAGIYKVVESKLSNGTKITEPTFIKLERRINDSSKPKIIWIGYISPTRIGNYIKDYHDNVIICAHEIDIDPYQLKDFKSRFHADVAPRIMYSFLMFNPNAASFKDQRVRQYFAQKYRAKLAERGYEVEGSQPTREMLGYISLADLNKLVPHFSKDEENKIIAHLRANPPVWMKHYNIVTAPFVEMFNSVCNDLGIPVQSEDKGSHKGQSFDDLWAKGEISIRQGYSTLGPADPTGDIKTVFSGIHSFLKTVTDDAKLQKLVGELKYNDQESHFKLNKYLFVDSKFAVVSNYSRVYFSTGKPKVKSSYRRQEPIAWEFFQQ